VHTDSGRYVQLIAEGRFEEAFLVARSPNALASVCGRVCAAPCEDACRRGWIDEPVTIRPKSTLAAAACGTWSNCVRKLVRGVAAMEERSPSSAADPPASAAPRT